MQEVAAPEPGLGPKRINVEENHSFTPEKFELSEGYVFWSEEERRNLLLLLLVNEGLEEAVRLAPRELWQEAPRRVSA
jgi:hypothetical protein